MSRFRASCLLLVAAAFGIAGCGSSAAVGTTSNTAAPTTAATAATTYGPGAHDDRHHSDGGPGHDVEPERR